MGLLASPESGQGHRSDQKTTPPPTASEPDKKDSSSPSWQKTIDWVKEANAARETAKLLIMEDIYAIWEELEKIRNEGANALTPRSEYVALHQELLKLCSARWLGIRAPGEHPYDHFYWDIAQQYRAKRIATYRFFIDKNQPELGHRDDLFLSMGKLKDFGPEIAGTMVDMNVRVYANELLRIDEAAKLEAIRQDWTKKQTERWRVNRHIELLLAMCKYFRNDYVVVLLFNRQLDEATQSYREHLIGSIGAVRGQNDVPFLEAIGKDGQDGKLLSALPTNTAIDYAIHPECFNPKNEEKYVDEMKYLREYEIAEVTRLAVPRGLVEDLPGMEKASDILVWAIHAAIARDLPDVKEELFNTKAKLNSYLRRLGLPVRVINTVFKITPAMKDTIYALYYRQKTTPEDTEPKKPDLAVQLLNVDEVLEICYKKLEKLGLDLKYEVLSTDFLSKSTKFDD